MLITFECGCIAYAHVPNEKRRKLDDKGEKCIFLSVSNYSKSYKLYNPITKKIFISRYINFYEKRHGYGAATLLDKKFQ